MKDLKKRISDEILNSGFDVVGFSNIKIDRRTKNNYFNFLKKNYHGEMKWLERHYRKKINPKLIWKDVKTILVVGQNYSPLSNPLKYNKKKSKANISVYASNEDYHVVIKEKLKKIQYWLKNKLELESKIFVDSSPILEKYFAQKASLGWQGKHTNIVSKKFGSWLFLAEIFLPIEIHETEKEHDNCGTCNKCIDICPTNALLKNNIIDSRRCISYLTIEYKGPFPMSLRKKIGNKVYGCDDCLSVCPWNKFSTEAVEKKLTSNEKLNDLDFFLNFNKKKFDKYFQYSPIKRIGWIRFLRNVIIASGNSKNKNLVNYLFQHLENENSIIRGSCVWSLSQLLDKKSKNKLKDVLLLKEKNQYVLYELNLIG